MTNKDKIVVAFLVSVGALSAQSAAQYVRALSDSQKVSFVNMQSRHTGVLLCSDTSRLPIENKSRQG